MAYTSRIRPMSQHAATFPRSTGEPPQTSKWEAVFGPMPAQPQVNAYSRYPNVNKQLPDAYIGQNVFLSEKVAGLIATTGFFWTGVLLPWLRSDHIGPFKWSRWEFNQQLATQVPHESVARLVTTEEREYQVQPVRRGLAMQMEGDFVNHPDGQIHFARKIQGMIASIQTTIDFDVQHTIITANDQRKMEQQRIGRNELPIKKELDLEKDLFAGISKGIEYFSKLVADARAYLMGQGANPPFTLLVPPEAIIDTSYFTTPSVVPQRLVGGTTEGALDPRGQLGRTDLPTGDYVTPDGTAVFQVRSINFGSKGLPYQMLSRPKLIAEYYHLSWNKYMNANLFDGVTVGPSVQYYSDMRSILIKNETVDDMAKVTLETCLRHGGTGSTGFPDMDIIKRLAQNNRYNPQDFDPGVDPLTGNPVPEKMHSKTKRRAHMMLTLGLPSSPRPVRTVHFVGQMDSNVTSAKNIEQIAQTVIASVPGITEQDMRTAWDLIDLMQTLESASYNDEFFKALIRVNSARNWRSKGTTQVFVGATLAPNDPLAEKWDIPRGYVEWRPNDKGTMDLPLWDAATMGDEAVPVGMANFQGLVALRALKGKTHGYGDLPNRADAVLKLLAKLGFAFSKALETEAMDADNRAPWYLKSNPLSTMFESCINAPRDPLFLLAVPYEGGRASDSTYGKKATPKMAAPSLQRVTLRSVLTRTDGTERDEDVAIDALGDGLSRFPGITRIFLERGSAVGTGTTVVGDQTFLAGLALSPTITALRKLGRMSGEAYIRINKILLNEETIRKKLAGLLNAPATSAKSAKQLVLGLDKLIENLSDDAAKKVIDEVASGKRNPVKRAMAAGSEAQSKSGFTDPDLKSIFTSRGATPTAVETVLRDGFNVEELAALIPEEEVTRFLQQSPELGDAVDRILSIVQQIHEERRQIGGDAYDSNEYYYIPPGVQLSESETTALSTAGAKNVKDFVLGDRDPVPGLLDELRRAENAYRSIALEVIGTIPPNFGGLGEKQIPGVPRPRPITETEVAGRIAFTEAGRNAARYYRSSLVMTPGLRDSFGNITVKPLVRPSDPASGHLEPWAGGNGEQFPDRLLNRPQYKSLFAGDFERDFSHAPWNTHHLETLAYLKKAGSRGYSTRQQYADIFAGTGISSRVGAAPSSSPYDDDDDDDIFGDADVVEGLLSGTISAHTPGQKRYDGPSWGYDQVTDPDTKGIRPFAGYTGFEAAVLAEGDKPDDDGKGAWLINNMQLGSIKYHIMMANKITNPIVRWAAMAVILSRIDHVDYWLKMVKANVLVPCNVLLFRPAMEFVMDNFIMMKAGSETGGTLFNHSSAMLGWDVHVRMIYLNYLFYSKAFVWSPEYIFVMENAMPRSYIAGGGVEFITSIEQLATSQSRERHDLLAIIVPIQEVHFDEDIGLLGNRNEVYGDVNPDFDGPMDTPQYSSADYVREWLSQPGGASIEQMLHEHKRKRIEYFQSIGTLPPTVSQGYYQTWGGKSFSVAHAGKGHKGDYGDYQGSRKVWNRRGSPYFLKRAEQPFQENI